MRFLPAFCCVSAAAVMSLSLPVCAETVETDDIAQLTEQLYIESGADELIGGVPGEALPILDALGFTGFGAGGTDGISPGGVVSALSDAVKENMREPVRVLCCLAGIVILAAALEAVKSGGAADSALSLVSSLCAVSVVAPPILSLTGELTETICASSSFMLLYVPVISGLMTASGHPASGTMYAGVMIWLSGAVLQLASRLVVPLLKCVMSLSVVSAAGETVRFDGVADIFRRAARFILTFCMSIFAAFLTMRTIVSAAADSLTNRAVRFAVGSFVPVVGGALSDAYQTVVACVSLLKSGVGAAAIAAVFAIFVPVAVRCVLWQAVCTAGAALCGVFGVSRVSSLLSSLSSVVSVMFAVLLCTMVIYIISTAILLIVGG